MDGPSPSATMTMPMHDQDPSAYLASSLSSLRSARSQGSWIAKAYKSAAQLYLTRRLAEALRCIEPVVEADRSLSNDGGGGGGGMRLSGYSNITGNGFGSAYNGSENGSQIDGDGIEGKYGAGGRDGRVSAAPIAAASRNTRVKVWSFFLTLLNAIIELGPEEGKLVFGSSKWRSLAAKARDGGIWEEVVTLGYGGVEGDVDGEVVVNLATLLLTHMPSQKLNQQRLETYLSSTAVPNYDLEAHMAAKAGRQRVQRTNSGTDTPRDLNTRLKLLELYTLHVLPQNGEWEYARECITLSEVLDDERREAFQFALQSLEEEKNHDAIREAELKKRQEEEMAKRRQDEERKKQQQQQQHQQHQQQTTDGRASTPNGQTRDRPSSATGPKRHEQTINGSQSNGQGHSHGPPPASSRHRAGPQKKQPVSVSPAPPVGIYQKMSRVMASLQHSILNAQRSLSRNPMVMLRYLLFLLAFTLAFARRDVRERIRRTFGDGFDKLRRTIGMGVKVSYI